VFALLLLELTAKVRKYLVVGAFHRVELGDDA